MNVNTGLARCGATRIGMPLDLRRYWVTPRKLSTSSTFGGRVAANVDAVTHRSKASADRTTEFPLRCEFVFIILPPLTRRTAASDTEAAHQTKKGVPMERRQASDFHPEVLKLF